jgi:hypothetical protein
MCLLWGTKYVFISQKTAFFIVTAVKTSNLRNKFSLHLESAGLLVTPPMGRDSNDMMMMMMMLIMITQNNFIYETGDVRQPFVPLCTMYHVPCTSHLSILLQGTNSITGKYDDNLHILYLKVKYEGTMIVAIMWGLRRDLSLHISRYYPNIRLDNPEEHQRPLGLISLTGRVPTEHLPPTLQHAWCPDNRG